MSHLDYPDLAPGWAPTGLPHDLPDIAIAVRQPWAYAIIHLGKNIENRTRGAIDVGGMRSAVGRRIAIHASKGMKRSEYEEACGFISGLGHQVPPAAELQRGGIIGSVVVTELVTLARRCADDPAAYAAFGPWFFGPWGLRLAAAKPCPFVGANGALGLFKWHPSSAAPEPPARWMVGKAAAKPQLEVLL